MSASFRDLLDLALDDINRALELAESDPRLARIRLLGASLCIADAKELLATQD